jgi:hypothetical protein
LNPNRGAGSRLVRGGCSSPQDVNNA